MDRRDELQTLTRAEIAATLGQDPEHELMGHFERHLASSARGSTAPSWRFARSGTVEELATELASWPTWYDISPYDGERVPFFKRAQIAAADLALAGLTDRPTTSTA